MIASGGVYTERSPIRDRDVASKYLCLILNVIGITEVTIVVGAGAKAVDMGEQTMEASLPALGPTSNAQSMLKFLLAEAAML